MTARRRASTCRSRRPAADEDQGRARPPGKALGERDEAFELRGGDVRLGVVLAGADGGDLRAHQRAEAGEPREQRVVTGISARSPVRVDDPPCQPRRAERLEVHHEEGQVDRHVRDSERRIELDAVDDLRRVLEDHVLDAQVAVPVAHEPTRGAPGQVMAACSHERAEEAPEGRDAGRVDRTARAEVVERRPHRVRERLRRAFGVGRPARDEMKGGETLADALGIGVGRRRRAHSSGERVRLGEPAHLDGELDRVLAGHRVVRDKREAVAAADQSDRAEIHVWRETPVEAHLLAAQGAPAVERALVEERQHDRLLDLVRARAREEHPGGMRVHDRRRRRAGPDRCSDPPSQPPPALHVRASGLSRSRSPSHHRSSVARVASSVIGRCTDGRGPDHGLGVRPSPDGGAGAWEMLVGRR